MRDFEFTGELCVFDLLGIMLYHGWVVDPSSEAATIIKDLSYNQLTNNIFAWREEAIKNNNNDLLVKGTIDPVISIFYLYPFYYYYYCVTAPSWILPVFHEEHPSPAQLSVGSSDFNLSWPGLMTDE